MSQQPEPQQPPPFSPQTVLNPGPNGIQIIVQYAPQVAMVVDLTLDQVKKALGMCLQMRQQQQAQQAAIEEVRQRRNLKVQP